MYLSISEITQWFGVTIFELWLLSTSCLIFSLQLVLRLEGHWAASYWVVFVPLFAGDALLTYFNLIRLIRKLYRFYYLRRGGGPVEQICRPFSWSCFWISCFFTFKFLLCSKLEGQQATLTYSEVTAPLLAWLVLVMARACQTTQ